ncbi:hypothetical protein FH972_024374 [Carpinus fangiana]|uniref:Major facilitator superfamily (MFS) profile domain-containing protein n=1 Tax=Carpinus fangiana TaxID=176857 RepID=A0A5N6KYA2_9ROSI|nr:hypothetical protein FH972_024374 [Carpinus fangiana]
MQPLGQLLALVVALGVVAGYKKHIETTGTSNCMMPGGQGRNVECTKTLDSAWRWIVGLGAFPALFAISFRLMIPESPRYLMDVRRKVEAAAKQTHRYFEQAPSPEVYARNIAQSQPLKMVQYPSTTTSSAPANPMTVETYFSSPRATADDHDQHTTQTVSRTASMVESITYREPSEADMETDTDQEPRASLSDAKDYFITQDTIFASSPLQDKTHLYGLLLGRLEQILIIISVGAVVGGAIFLKVIHYMSPKRIQFWGFIALAFLLLITGSAFEKLNTGLIVFYALIQLFFNLGPNTTTYIMSAELYPTRYRCTCHGISAAAGKLGAIIAQLIVQVPKFRDANWLGHGLQIFCAFMALGAAVTWLLTPETRDAKGKSRTLEELARGHKMFEEAREQAEDARRLET